MCARNAAHYCGSSQDPASPVSYDRHTPHASSGFGSSRTGWHHTCAHGASSGEQSSLPLQYITLPPRPLSSASITCIDSAQVVAMSAAVSMARIVQWRVTDTPCTRRRQARSSSTCRRIADGNRWPSMRQPAALRRKRQPLAGLGPNLHNIDSGCGTVFLTRQYMSACVWMAAPSRPHAAAVRQSLRRLLPCSPRPPSSRRRQPTQRPPKPWGVSCGRE